MLNPEISKTWDVNPADVGVYCFTFPDNSLPLESIDWIFSRFPYTNFRAAYYPDKPLTVARNLAAHKFLTDPAQHEWMLLVDRDVRPDWRSDFMFNNPTDAVCCQWEDDRPWYLDRTVFHMSLAMVHRRVLEAMEPPHFQFEYSPEGFQLLSCDCTYFQKKAEALGFKLSNNGWVNHEKKRTWCGR